MAVKTKEEIKKELLDRGLVSAEDIARAEKLQRDGKSLVEALVEMGLIDEAVASEFLEEGSRVRVDLGSYGANPSAIAVLPEKFARRYLALPLDFEGDRLLVAMANPSDLFAIDDLRIVTGYEINPVGCDEQEILDAINKYYKHEEEKEVEESLEVEEGGEEAAIEEVASEEPIVKLVNLIITQAVRNRASDIHVEPQEEDVRVRYRIDGVLHEVMRSPKRIQLALTSRFKIMAGMDIAERRKPQDGHTSLTVLGKKYDFRVATLPTVYGERVVLRILEKESILMDLDDLGFLPESLERFRSAFTKPYGTILVTGPTGSGKSTTLYATLNVLNTPERNIVTIEDPVEYRLPGINQVQVNPKAGLTFARGLRSILRTSPDIIMVGEIRDKETAQIAIEAALTGHLVLSTLHTNDAPSAITRLTEMGIPPFLTSSAVDCVQAQRLARRLCNRCKEPYTPSPELLKRIGYVADKKEELVFYRPKGCKNCGGTGYKGRVGIYEVMLVSETIERLTVEKKTAEEIKQVAIAEGMKTLMEDGLEKVKLGITSVEEVLRVVT